MLFKTKKSQRREYVNPEIEKEIEEKGFSVYNYISLKELFLTVQRDYLEILSIINLPFWIITIVLWVIWYLWETFSLFFYFLFFSYIIIFIILAVKLILRAYYFMKITDVVYTENWIILWNELYKYNDEDNLFKKLSEYSDMFEEFLSKPSSLRKIIRMKKKWILDENWNLLSNSVEITSDFWKDWVQLAIPVVISQFIYIIFLYLFYYFWYFFWIIIFSIINVFLKIILKFSKNKEVAIKWKLEDIDSSFKNMSKIEKILSNKISNFKSWEISDISSSVDKNFSNFYSEVIFIFNEKKKLFNLIKKSKFKDFVNFEKLEKYLKNNFNKPVLEMISMLEKFRKLLEKQIELLRITQKNNNTKINNELTYKEIILEKKLNILKQNIYKLEKSVI